MSVVKILTQWWGIRLFDTIDEWGAHWSESALIIKDGNVRVVCLGVWTVAILEREFEHCPNSA